MALLGAEVAHGQLTLTTTYSTGPISTQRRLRLRAGTFPAPGIIYYLDGSTWKPVDVGPGRGEVSITANNSQYVVKSSTIFTGNQLPVGSSQTVDVPPNFTFVQFAMSAAARDQGPYFNVSVELPAMNCEVIYGAGTGQSGLTHTYEPPVYAFYLATPEGGAGIGWDSGGPPDADNDGIPDDVDPDDDNDGKPDDEDAFPSDPDEDTDTDGDGTGDNADSDDDNDGVPDDQDAFPKNPQEDADNDGDGVGDNQDPDDDSKPPPDAGDGDNDNVGDGNGNPGTGDGGGGGGFPGDTTPDIGDLGAPANLQKRPKSYFDKQVKTTPGSITGESTGVPVEEAALGFFADSVEQLGKDMQQQLGAWQPFGDVGGVSGGDMTQWSITTQAFGTVTIPFPVQPQSIGVFRACCLFALYWGYCLFIMRILRV